MLSAIEVSDPHEIERLRAQYDLNYNPADHYEELKDQGIRPHRCVNHGMTTSMYYYDPDHNQVELLFDNFHIARAGRDYMTSRSESDKNPVGIDFDPDELVAQVREGLRIEELTEINA